jgi:orotidine-5'-phosphate decarboxylase
MALEFKSPAQRIFAALDVPDTEKAKKLVDVLGPTGCSFKIGMQLFYSGGAGLVRELVDAGNTVFLDLKLHDIPNTVAGAVHSLAGLGAQIVNIHASGGLEMMRAARAAANETGVDSIIAVTVLTSLGDEDLKELGFAHTSRGEVMQLARLARQAELDGVVCSPKEIRILRDEIGEDFLLITPGIRPSWSAADDQKRIMTPAEAFEKGASAVVIGRPITKNSDPAEALQRILDEIQ